MNLFDNEEKIIDYFHTGTSPNICIMDATDKLISVFESVYLPDEWKNWTNSSGKSDPPPDFYNDSRKLMMDIMRIDDHAYIDDKGKVINEVNARESKLQKEIKDSRILDICPNCKGCFVNPKTTLSTEEDHNYDRYLENFTRIIKKHISKIPLYKENHKGYKVIFFIFDESSAYIEVEQDGLRGTNEVGKINIAEPHFPYLDKNFIDVIKKTDIDYLIWFTPFKYFETIYGKMDFSNTCVIDTKRLNFKFKSFTSSHMLSTEV